LNGYRQPVKAALEKEGIQKGNIKQPPTTGGASLVAGNQIGMPGQAGLKPAIHLPQQALVSVKNIVHISTVKCNSAASVKSRPGKRHCGSGNHCRDLTI